MNQQDNNAKSKAVDSLLNFETVDMSDSCFLKKPNHRNMNMNQIYPIGKILQCRELWSQPLWGRHLKISGWSPLYWAQSQNKLLTLRYYIRRCQELSQIDAGLHLEAFYLFVGVWVEDPGIPGLPQPNTEPPHWIRSAGRLAALRLLCDWKEISGIYNSFKAYNWFLNSNGHDNKMSL